MKHLLLVVMLCLLPTSNLRALEPDVLSTQHWYTLSDDTLLDLNTVYLVKKSESHDAWSIDFYFNVIAPDSHRVESDSFRLKEDRDKAYKALLVELNVVTTPRDPRQPPPLPRVPQPEATGSGRSFSISNHRTKLE